MVEFIIMIAIIVICIMLFGKADSKRTVLNTVGLDLSEKNYTDSKEKEFEKYCKKSMKTAVTDHNATGNNEKEFLERLEYILYYASHDGSYYDEDGLRHEGPSFRLYVYTHYTKFAEKVVSRRIHDLKNGDKTVLLSNCDFKSKQDLKKYIDKLWEKYQYPWPDNWLIKDGI